VTVDLEKAFENQAAKGSGIVCYVLNLPANCFIPIRIGEFGVEADILEGKTPAVVQDDELPHYAADLVDVCAGAILAVLPGQLLLCVNGAASLLLENVSM
jgi:hypothetical protein